MTITANDTSTRFDLDRAAGNGHGPARSACPLGGAELGAVYPTGLIMAKDGDGVRVPYGSGREAAVGVGDGAVKAFSATLGPIKPGALVITDGTEAFSADLAGNLTGDGGGSGSVDYATGTVELTFNAAPANEAAVTATLTNVPSDVLDAEVDTTDRNVGVCIVHGSVRLDMLKVGVAVPADPTDAEVAALGRAGIFVE